MKEGNEEILDKKIIKITCPECGKHGNLEVPERLFQNGKHKSVKVQVSPGMICKEHAFVAIVLVNGTVMGYEKIDMSIGDDDDKIYSKFTLQKVIDFYGFYALVNLIHAKLFDYPVFIINYTNIKVDVSELNQFFENIIPNFTDNASFIQFISESNQESFISQKGPLLFIDSRSKIMQASWNHEALFEEDLLKKAMTMKEESMRVSFIRQELSEFMKSAKHLMRYISKNEKPEFSDKELARVAGKDIKKKYLIQIKNIFIEKGFFNNSDGK